MQIEKIILANLIYNEFYTKKVVPFIKSDYFQENIDKQIFITIKQYIDKYNLLPTKEAILIDIDNTDINDEEKNSIEKFINELKNDPNTSNDWLISVTEEFCQDQAMFLALNKAIQIHEGKEKKLLKGSIPTILAEALSVSFNSNIGHDYFDDAEKRYDWYHLVENKIPFGIDILNKITRGGVSKKSLTIIMAGINVGKTALMAGFAAHNLRDGKNVLYITLEMSEEMITQRIEANMLDLAMDDIPKLEKQAFLNRVDLVKKLTSGRLKVKEFPTSKAGEAHFKHLLNELKLKQNFIPDIIYIDYLNICCSSRYKPGTNSYEYVKGITEEIRGLAVENDLPVITATQFNRAGFKSSDPGLDDASESFGTGATADLVFAAIRNDEMDKLGQLMISQLKNRYSNKSKDKKFVIGVDIEKMKFYNVDDDQQNLHDEDEQDVEESIFSSSKSNKRKMDFSSDDFKDFL